MFLQYSNIHENLLIISHSICGLQEVVNGHSQFCLVFYLTFLAPSYGATDDTGYLIMPRRLMTIARPTTRDMLYKKHNQLPAQITPMKRCSDLG